MKNINNRPQIIDIIPDRNRFQTDLLEVCSWTRTWLMELNTKKCKFLHFAHANSAQVQPYYMDELDHFGQLKRAYLDQSNSERDLGVQIITSLKQHQQVSKAAARANWVLGSLKRSFTSRDVSLWKKLYTTYVRPHLEFCIQAWNPHLAGDTNLLEQVQRRATRIPHVLKGQSYENRCWE